MYCTVLLFVVFYFNAFCSVCCKFCDFSLRATILLNLNLNVKMKLGMVVGLGPGHTVRWGPSLPPRKGHNSPSLFLAYVYCGQTVAHLSCC